MRNKASQFIVAAIAGCLAFLACTKTVPAPTPSPKMSIELSGLSNDGVQITVDNTGDKCYSYKFLAPVKAADVQGLAGDNPEKEALEAWFNDNSTEVGLPCSYAGNKLNAATAYVTAALALAEDGSILECKYLIFRTLNPDGIMDGSGNAGSLDKEGSL